MLAFLPYRKLGAALATELLTCPMLLACQKVIRSVAEIKIPSINISDQDMTPSVRSVDEGLVLQLIQLARSATNAFLSCFGLNTLALNRETDWSAASVTCRHARRSSTSIH